MTKDLINIVKTWINVAFSGILINYYEKKRSILSCFVLQGNFQEHNSNIKWDQSAC
jgi:hypothetical protein